MNLFEVDIETLTELEQMQLAEFRDAYRPHSPIPTRKVLKVEGEGTYFPKVNTLDEIKEQVSVMDTMYYYFLETVTRDANGNIMDDVV